MFGQGFFALAVGAKEIRVKSGVGNGTTTYVTLTPVLSRDSEMDFTVQYDIVNEDFTGTTIERIDTSSPNEAHMLGLFAVNNTLKYISNVCDVPIRYKEQIINAYDDTIAHGKARSNPNTLTQREVP